tara:strand:- start:2917 stop:3372 length:456 start_codon:yes stop_codon:yes gene_type:complete
MKDFHKKYKRCTPWWRFMTAEFKLLVDHSEQTPVMGFTYEDDKVRLTRHGILTIKPGFVFGASGPTFDRLPFGIFRKQMKSTRRGVCKHDAFYHISCMGVFRGPKSEYIRALTDNLLRDDILSDGGWKLRAEAWEETLEKFGDGSWEKGLN